MFRPFGSSREASKENGLPWCLFWARFLSLLVLSVRMNILMQHPADPQA